MAKPPALPVEVHDHFRKAFMLHGYVETHLGEASKFAFEAGQELLAAKKAIPHGRWEVECNRIFSPSLRTAQFYMNFTKHMMAIPKAQRSVILMLEGTLTGAAKLAKQAARKASGNNSRKGAAPAGVTDDQEPAFSSGGDDDLAITDEGKAKRAASPPKKLDRPAYFKQWENAIGPIVRLVDKIASGVGESRNGHHKDVQEHLNNATETMKEWMEVE